MDTYKFSKGEEIANAITHGVGALLAIAGLVLLIVFSALEGSAWHITSFTIFGATLTVLYVMSTLYHSLTSQRVKRLFRKFDHMSIFLLIAGTYTPFCLTVLRGWIGWVRFGVVWSCAIGGIVLKAFHTGKKKSCRLFYISNGLDGGIFYQARLSLHVRHRFYLSYRRRTPLHGGAFFFVRDKIPFYHSIWHLFVLGGSIFIFSQC